MRGSVGGQLSQRTKRINKGFARLCKVGRAMEEKKRAQSENEERKYYERNLGFVDDGIRCSDDVLKRWGRRIAADEQVMR